MSPHDHVHPHDEPSAGRIRTCCPQCCPSEGVSRRDFLGAAALGGVALSGLSWSTLVAAQPDVSAPAARKPVVVKPVLFYDVYTPRPQTSWRPWGGIQKPEDVEKETAKINAELESLGATADFPVQFLPIAAVRNPAQLKQAEDVAKADVLLVYAAGGQIDGIEKLGKHTILFMRHKSGPVYLWYEIVSPRFLRQHSDVLAVKGIDEHDVVVDSQEEILWRLRALCGLVNTVGSKILAVGGPSGWATPAAPKLALDKFKLDIQTISYPELGKLIEAARADKAEIALAKKRAAEYLKLPGTTLETKSEFVDNAFLLEQVFRRLMAKAGCRAMTINSCMGTIMPMSQTTACLPLSTLNDDGFLAFCESDFVVIPAGILANGITGKPTFLNDPTYPHDGIITIAHCTGPRKMDGKTVEPVRILTHFESDYGAAPKVEMKVGQKVTNILPDFKQERYVGLLAEIVAAPFLPICRCQVDIKFNCSSQLVAERMPGFHWMTIYGDYMKELGYALKRIPITWEALG